MGRPKGVKNKKAKIIVGQKPTDGLPFRIASVYSVSLKVNDKEYIGLGDTLESALESIKVEPRNGVIKIYTKGVLKVTKGEKTVERLLFIRQMSRLFGTSSRLGKEVAMAQTTRLFKALFEDNRK